MQLVPVTSRRDLSPIVCANLYESYSQYYHGYTDQLLSADQTDKHSSLHSEDD